MVDLCKDILAEDIEPGNELDLDGDEYADNDKAIFAFAVVNNLKDWYDSITGDPWITLWTSQGIFDMPAGHIVKVKVQE